jgi:uncharacterized cofD-like protein
MKIVTVGGGSGGSIIDEALNKKYRDLTAVVTSFDDGGSTGILRREFGTVPQGDIRRRIYAQKNYQNDFFEQIYNYRFGENNSLENHSVGNLLILTAQKIWGEKEGIRKVCEFFKISGKVLPVTFDYAELAAKLSDGRRILGEELVGQSIITKRLKEDLRNIDKIYLTRETKINKEVVSEILKSDYIVLCPGDFYTSLIPNFLVPGFCEAVKRSKAKIILFVNIMTKASETRDFKVSDFLFQTKKYLGKKIDFVIVNNKRIDKKILNKYKRQEGAEIVVNDLKGKDTRVIELPLVKSNGHIRHDKKLVFKAFGIIVGICKKK